MTSEEYQPYQSERQEPYEPPPYPPATGHRPPPSDQGQYGQQIPQEDQRSPFAPPPHLTAPMTPPIAPSVPGVQQGATVRATASVPQPGAASGGLGWSQQTSAPPASERGGDEPTLYGRQPGGEAPPFGQPPSPGTGGYGQQPGGTPGMYGQPPASEAAPFGQYAGGGPGMYGQQQPGVFGQQQPGEFGQQSFGGPMGGEGESSSGMYGQPAAPEVTAESKKRRTLMIVLAAVAVLVVLAAGGTGVMMYLTGKSGSSFAVNSCVKKSGESAVSTSCSDGNAYKIVTKTTTQANCPDQNQPFVIIEHDDGENDVLCLRPAKE